MDLLWSSLGMVQFVLSKSWDYRLRVVPPGSHLSVSSLLFLRSSVGCG